MTDRPDTRTRIREVALELFIEHGYDKTSLREIAERLGVTKAALYYHFPTKDDIVASLIEDRIEQVESLIDWARNQPRTPDTRREVVHRYALQLYERSNQDVMRFFERNQATIKSVPAGERLRSVMYELVALLTDPNDSPTVQLKHAMAIFAIHASWFLLADPNLALDDRLDASLAVAFELVGVPAATSG